MKINNNIPVLDSLRAFAAISVCLYHYVCTTTGYITTDWILNLFSYGKYGVQLFFVISGFVIPWAMFRSNFKMKNFFNFLLKRLTRLEPPYIVSIILAIAVLYLREKLLGFQNEEIHISAKQIILHFGYLIPFFEGYKWLNQVYWTLAIEFQYYFFIAFLFVPLVKSNFISRLVIYTFILSISFFGSASFLLYWLPVFLIGIILFLYKAKLINNKEYYSVSVLIFVICFYKYPFGSVFFMMLPVALVLYYSNLKIKILNFLGRMSYSIYLIHPLAGASLINVLSHSIKSDVGKVIVICLGLLVTLIFSYLMYLIVEKPSKKLSSSIIYNKQY